MREWIHRAQVYFLCLLTLSVGHWAAADEPARPQVEPTAATSDTSAPLPMHVDQFEALQGQGPSTFTDRLREQLKQSEMPDRAISDVMLASFEYAGSESIEAQSDTPPTSSKPAFTTVPDSLSTDSTPAKEDTPNSVDSEAIPEWTGNAPPEALDLEELVTRLAIGTGIVLLVAVVSVLVIRKWLGPAATLRQPVTQRLRHIESLVLPQRASIQLVELDGRPILIGMNADGLQTITPIERSFSESLSAIKEEDTSEPVPLDDGFVTAIAPEETTVSTIRPAAESWTGKAAAFLSSHLTPARQS
jgi:flagellar biogenesis protein FliO